MLRFMKSVVVAALGTILGLGLLFFFMVGVFAGMAAMEAGGDEAQFLGVKDNSVLKIKLDGQLKDHMTKRDVFASLFFSGEPQVLGLYELSRVLQEAAKDERIRGVLLDFVNLQSGVANVESLRREIAAFKKSKKFVMAYAENFSEVEFMLATAADEIVLYPKGFFEWNGLFGKAAFLKNTMAKLDVVPQIFKVGKYKSAVETYTNEKMSAASREQTEAIISSIWEQILGHAAEKTQTDKMTLDKMAEEMKVMFAEDALKNGFVNQLASREEVDDKILALSEAKEKPNYVSWRQYLGEIKKNENNSSKNTVALIFASGEILSQHYDDDMISSEKMRPLLDKIRRDKDVKAVVLRVNSPGGSALASDVIWTGTQWLKDDKPLVTSFGNVAASGGYYMSAGSQYIFAEPSTITGSIGVFGVAWASKKFWKGKLGVTFDTVKSHRYSDLESLVRPMVPAESQKIQDSVEKVYEDFLKVVTLGREALGSREQAHDVAQGRVWIGADALGKGLVDELGGLNQAVAKAAELAQLENFKVEVYPKELSPFQEFMKEFGTMSRVTLKALLPEPLQNLVKSSEKRSLSESIRARLPFDLVIE